MDRIIWSLKTTSNWSVQMTFLILGAVLKLLLFKSGKLGMWHLCSFWVIYIPILKEKPTFTHFRNTGLTSGGVELSFKTYWGPWFLVDSPPGDGVLV